MISKIRQHKSKIYLMQLASLQILINFGTNFYIVHKIGFNAELDILYISLAVFAFLTSSIGWSISSVLTPILIENREKKIEGEMFVSISFIVIPIFVVVMLSMYFWSKLLYANYLDTIEFDKILTIQTFANLSFLFSTLNILFLSMFQEKNQYIKINLLNMLGAIVGFIFVCLTIEDYGIYSAGLYQVIIQIFLFFVMWLILCKSTKFNFKYNREILSLLWHRMKYIFFGSFYYRTGTIIDRIIASYFTAGTLSLIGFVEKIYGAIITVLNSSISGPTITMFSNLIKEGKHEQIKKSLYNYFILLLIIDMFMLAFVIVFGKDLFLYFFSDRIDISLIPMLSIILLFLFSIVFGKTLGMLQKSLMMSSKNEKAVTYINSFVFTIGMILKITLSYYYGIIGLLISILLNEVLTLIIQMIYIERKILNEIAL